MVRVTKEAHELPIVHELDTATPLNDLHRPRFLLLGLLTCAVCGGGYTITAKGRYGCARQGRQGTCSNHPVGI